MMGSRHCLMLCLFIFTLLLLFELTCILDDLDRYSRVHEDPLYLTTLIEEGALEKARELAMVVRFDMGNVDSFSGYFTVNKKYNSNIFFWYFPAKIDSEHAPVLLWLQGSLGISSLLGLFTENGPFELNEKKRLNFREYSWHNNHNLIYMDNPVGAGYSFTDDNRGLARNATGAGDELYIALVQFFTLFPTLAKNEFYIAGESYAGKYIPAVAKAIKDNNGNATVKINLQGLAIGNGMVDPYNQINYGDYLYQIGLIDFNGREEFKQLEDKAKHFIEQEEWKKAHDAINQLIGDSDTSLFRRLTGFNFSCNYLNASEPNSSTWFTDYVQKPDVQRALHVGDVVFNNENNLVREYMQYDVPRSTTAYYLPELLEHYKVLIYNGQLDIMMTFPQITQFLENLAWSGSEDYKNAKRKPWLVGEEFAGYVKTARNLTQVLVRNAGHRIGVDQSKWAWNLITRFTHSKSF